MKKITVLLAEDHMIVREGFRKMLELEDDIEVVGEAQDGRQAVALVNKLRPAVVLMDIAMPLLNGLEATRQVLKAIPATKVLMLSAHSDDAYVTNATESGAVGFLLKQTSAHDVCRAIREVQKGKLFSAPPFPGVRTASIRQIARPRGRAPQESRPTDFARDGSAPTDRRRQGQQGNRLRTRHRHQDRREASRASHAKLDIHDTAGLTRYAISAGIIESSVQLTIV
jgi:DNA-binding NarL/FixJ family response regulator